MDNVNIPEGYQQLMPYLILKNAARFQTFMERVFSAREVSRHMRDEQWIMHGEIKIGESTIMFADSTDVFGVTTGAFFIYVADADEAYNKALAEGAVSITSVGDMEYGRSGGVKDPFGNTWWITSVAGNGSSAV